MQKRLSEVLEKHSCARLLSRQEAADYLGVSAATLAIWASLKRYALPYIKVGRLAKYHRADLDAFVRARRVGNLPTASEGGA